jgi:uncharacterized membrane protein YiaA
VLTFILENVMKKENQAFYIASWVALGIGVASYLVGLWNAELENAIKGYYFTVFAFGLYAAVSIQKTVRDRIEQIPVSSIYYGISALSLFGIAIYQNDDLILSEKGFYSIAYVLSLYSCIVVQKNVRDAQVSA